MIIFWIVRSSILLYLSEVTSGLENQCVERTEISSKDISSIIGRTWTRSRVDILSAPTKNAKLTLPFLPYNQPKTLGCCFLVKSGWDAHHLLSSSAKNGWLWGSGISSTGTISLLFYGRHLESISSICLLNLHFLLEPVPVSPGKDSVPNENILQAGSAQRTHIVSLDSMLEEL